MKRWLGLALLIFVGAAGWRIGGSLSSDALSMAVGVLFGVMAGVPTALFMMAGSRRRSEARTEEINPRELQGHVMRLPGQPHGQAYPQMHQWGMPPYAQQPPIIIVAGPHGFSSAHPTPPANAAWLAQDPPARHFNMVGENEAFLEEW